MESKKENELVLIPKSEKYIQYMIEIIMKLPRTEKFSIGTEYKTSMYRMISHIIYLSKINLERRLEYVNLIDMELNVQRIYLRIMYNNKWIDERRFKFIIESIYEIGKIVGGLTKFYVQKQKESEIKK